MSSTSHLDSSANPEAWPDNQKYELHFWKENWPYRDLPIAELQKLRQGDGTWFLKSLGFAPASDGGFEGFSGEVLEVGCGPIGFFELMPGVMVTAIDSLMRAYAAEISFSTLGARGSTTYIDKGLADVTEQYPFVVCSNVLDHTADWMEFLELLVKRVRPGGELLLVTDTRRKPMIGHAQVFTPDQLRRGLAWLGFDRLHHHRIGEKKGNHCDHQVFIRASRSSDGR